MKKIVRMLIFSAVAIYLTSLWNKGFLVNFEPIIFFKTILVISLIYYLIVPLSKIVLLPFNILFLGLASTLVYFLVFYFVTSGLGLIQIEAWTFPGFQAFGLIIQKSDISYLINLILSALSVSFIISLLELLI